MDLSITPLEKWGLPVKDIFLSAGPCSAESEEQLLETARALSDCGISFLRAGIWKPRTHPGSFEGVGSEGLKWLAKVKEETGIPVGTEAAYPEHVEECLKHGIDVIWIGARSTSNPFAVQALADALKGKDVTVLIKNPISPDIELWIGAVERIYNAGLRRIGVIHRGFGTTEKILYRNAPNWKIPIEFKRRFPHIPLLCDPSHICGDAALIFSIAQEALDLLYDGLMIEVHPRPREALSDARQQITPDEFRALMSRLIVKEESTDSTDFRQRLKELRTEVDSIDKHLIKLLAKRMDIARKMGKLKHKNNISILQPHRWEEIIESRIAEGKEQDLSGEFIFQLFQTIHEEAIQQQERDLKK